MAKETKELVRAAGAALDSGIKAAQPGQNIFTRMAHFLGDVGTIEDGAEGFNLVGAEAETIGNVDVTQAFDAFESELSSLSQEDAFDIRSAAQGFYSIFRFAKRKAAQSNNSDSEK